MISTEIGLKPTVNAEGSKIVVYEPYIYYEGDATGRLADIVQITKKNQMFELTEEKLKDGTDVYIALVPNKLGEFVVAGVCGSFLQYDNDSVREIGGLAVLPEYREGAYSEEHIGTALAGLATQSALFAGKSTIAFCNKASLSIFTDKLGYRIANTNEIPKGALAECGNCKNCKIDKSIQPCADTIVIKHWLDNE